MRDYTHHSVLNNFNFAKSFANTNFCIATLPAAESLWPLFRGEMRNKISIPIMLYQHFLLVLSLVVNSRKWDLIIVREFNSEPLICFIWIAWPLRKKICFINNHNLQKALTGKLQRFAFVLLCKMKFRIAFLEGLDGLEKLNVSITPEQFLYIPQIVIPVQRFNEPTEKHKKRVGIVGAYRPEKGIVKLIPYLIAIQEKGNVDIMIGTTDCVALKDHMKSSESAIDIIDTSSSDGYAEALLSCDVVLFNYIRDEYYCRASGVMIDAIECGANVVCPNYPVFRRQVLSPVPVGYLFDNESEIVETVLSALADRDTLYSNIQAYSSFRNPQAIAKYIDDFARLNQLI